LTQPSIEISALVRVVRLIKSHGTNISAISEAFRKFSRKKCCADVLKARRLAQQTADTLSAKRLIHSTIALNPLRQVFRKTSTV